MAQDRGALEDAEAWYRRSLEIQEALGNRPGMGLTYAQLGLLDEEREEIGSAMAWAIRSVTLFETFGHRSTGTAPRQLARLTKAHGREVLAHAWREVTGQDLPEGLFEALERIGNKEEDS